MEKQRQAISPSVTPIKVEDISLPELAPFASLTESQLRREGAGGVLIAESPKVIMTALEAGLEPLSLLCEEKHISGDAAGIISRCGDIPVYTGDRDILARLTGYKLTRGVLCAMRRPEMPRPEEVMAVAKTICVLYDICDTTNVGAIFRTAAALGIDGILLSPETCDPFNRRAVRVSMGSVFQIAWCFCTDPIEALKRNGFKTLSLALRDDSIFLQDFKIESEERYAIVMGSEGYGLPSHVIESTDYTVKIPMHHGVDSLNVGAAAAITLWHFIQKGPKPIR